MNVDSKDVLVIAGPTASGKSALAMAAAEALGGEIINCDSVQLYQGFDIGSAKPSREERQRVRHHLIDVVSWRDAYDARRFAADAQASIEDVRGRGRLPVVVGGTGLYLRAMFAENFDDAPSDPAVRAALARLSNDDLIARLKVLDPERLKSIHPNDRYRLTRAVEIATVAGRPLAALAKTQGVSPWRARSLVVILEPERKVLHDRIARRTAVMLDEGWVEEVRALLGDGCPRDARPMQSIGYAEIALFLAGELPTSDLRDRIIFATRQYAKRQTTWFRKVMAELRLGGELSRDAFVAQVGKQLARNQS